MVQKNEDIGLPVSIHEQKSKMKESPEKPQTDTQKSKLKP